MNISDKEVGPSKIISYIKIFNKNFKIIQEIAGEYLQVYFRELKSTKRLEMLVDEP
ncbi:MAG: hypothetical protein JJP05_09540 [cyanobacterium endosymbiont of Rhopalodia gibba]|jgi:hypothetical protein